jgi:DNA-binding FadR family transcriptional regulator
MTKPRTYPRRGLHGAVVHEIGVRIVRGDFLQRHPLPPEEELGAQLGVSRTVLREAVKVLAAKRLVESRPKTGTRVLPRSDWNLLDPDVLAWQLEAGLTKRFLEDMQELRRLIEPAAARLAAVRADDDELEAIAEAFHEMTRAGTDLQAWLEPDLRFHAVLLQASRNELLAHMTSLVSSVLRVLVTFSSRPPKTFQRATPLHAAILDAIRARDPDAAELATHRLLDDTERNAERAFRESSDGSPPRTALQPIG